MRTIVTLTTIPPRGLSILETVKSIKQNTVKPDAIYVNLPKYLPRFPDQTFDPSLRSSLEDLGVIVNECEDFKTLTKFVPTLKNEIEDDTLFIVIDDDGVYSSRFIEGLINGYKEFNCAVGYSGIAYPDYVKEKYGRIGYLLFQEHGQESHILEASFGVAFKREWISNLNIQPPNLYDDYIIGLYLDEIGIKKRVINYDYIGRHGDDWSSIVDFINQDENAISYGVSSIEKYYNSLKDTHEYIHHLTFKLNNNKMQNEYRNVKYTNRMIIKYDKNKNELSYTIHEDPSNPATPNVYIIYLKMFYDVFDFSRDIVFPLCIGDTGCWYENVINVANLKTETHKLTFPHFQFFAYEDFDDKCKNLQRLGDEPYVHDKLFWIGSVYKNGTDTRKEFCKIKNDRIVNIDSLTSNVFVTHEEHTKYRYLLDIEGGVNEQSGYSARVCKLLHMKRLLFFVDRPIYSFIDFTIKPWVHYVPVKRDLSDLLEKIEWADSHPEETRKIIQNMTSIAPTRQDAYNQIKKIIDSL